MKPSVFSPVLRIYKQATYHISVTSDNCPLQPASPCSLSGLSCPGSTLLNSLPSLMSDSGGRLLLCPRHEARQGHLGHWAELSPSCSGALVSSLCSGSLTQNSKLELVVVQGHDYNDDLQEIRHLPHGGSDAVRFGTMLHQSAVSCWCQDEQPGLGPELVYVPPRVPRFFSSGHWEVGQAGRGWD